MKRYPALILLLSSFAVASERRVEEVIVNASFYERSLLSTANSISVIDSKEIAARDASHIEDVLNFVPNLNFASGASRGRFFQIRGIGERSQFVDPINPSVGLIVDGIDFTGTGQAAVTLDTQQIEVLRGPQGTYYGANALAGLINIVSGDPREQQLYAKLSMGQYNSRQLSHVVSGSITDDISARIAFGKTDSDGYIKNSYLDRDTTNGINEATFRTKVHWQVDDKNDLMLTAFFMDADNGYDAFTLDNSRTTLSDQPGHDRINTRAFSLKHGFEIDDTLRWENLMSHADSDLEYGYDEDWTYRTICSLESDCAFWQYSTFDNYARENVHTSLDSRLVSDAGEGEIAWVAGLYYRDQKVDLHRTYTNNDPNYDSFYEPISQAEVTKFSSDYDTQNIALYGQVDFPLSENLKLITGLRAENRDATYTDSNQERIDNTEDLWGGRVTLEYTASDDTLYYGLVSRGYKAGGNNVPGPKDENGNDLIPLVFDTEFMWNYELGQKAQWLNGMLDTSTAIFYQDRKDMQVKQSLVTSRDSGEVNGDCPCDFKDYLINSPGGSNIGLEAEANFYASESLRLWLNIGLLDAEFRQFTRVAPSPENVQIDEITEMDGRDIAHAPNYQLSTGFQWALTQKLSWRLGYEAKDAFFLSNRHEEKTESNRLWNTRLSYQRDNWEIAFWGRNLTDEEVIVRGFGSFGNDPRDGYVTEPYYQFGEPRVVGVSARLQFL